MLVTYHCEEGGTVDMLVSKVHDAQYVQRELRDQTGLKLDVDHIEIQENGDLWVCQEQTNEFGVTILSNEGVA